MKKKINMVAKKVIPPQMMNIQPILSSPIALTRGGHIILMIKFTVQFITVASETALSCIISAMYNQVIGPDANSKNTINAIKHTSIAVSYF